MKNLAYFLLSLCGFLALAACDAKTKNVDSCGDGFVDPGEECDSGVGEHSCASLGHYNGAGTLLCTPLCSFDRSDCGGRCGDDLVNGADGEECDGGNLNGNTCQGLGHGGGALACRADCTFDLGGCENACGNGYVEGDEACDDGNPDSGDGCSSACVIEEGWECDGATPDRCAPVCGDGMIVGDEPCDGDVPDGQTCVSLGFHGGSLTCAADCRLELGDCEAAGRCGDVTVQGASGEVCDGADLDGESCESLGFHPGTLTCAADCRSFNTQQCAGRCGDSLIQAEQGEVCDLNSLSSQTCESQGYYSGLLGCAADCTAFNLDGCLAGGRCGDGTIQIAYGETCDGANLGGQTCADLGYHGGGLSCTAGCRFDLAACEAVGRCGDGTIQGFAGEVCDGANLGGQTCLSRNYYGGALACDATCQLFDEADCALHGWCGDGTIQGAQGEVCDGTDLGGQTCRGLGHQTGTPTCAPGCQSVSDAACLDAAFLDAGDTHACMVLSDGSVRCWGANEYGQLGDGSIGGSRNYPVTVAGQSGVTMVTAGESFTCLLKNSGAVSCWGRNDFGQLGNGTTVGTAAPVTVTGLSTGVSALAAGSVHTCAQLSDGTVRCWGLGNSGQLGNGATTGSAVPVTVSGLSGVASLVSGVYHTCARLSDGTARCWGQNTSGQLGNGTNSNASTPVTVSGLSGVAGLGAGAYHTCAVLEDHSARCWGQNSNSQLGDGTYAHKNLPVAVTGLTGVIALSGGDQHTCARLDTGSLTCWGANWYGQLGDGTETDRASPVTVTGLSAATSLSCGQNYACAVTGLRVRCWGRNEVGQLGDSTGIAHRTIPSNVSP